MNNDIELFIEPKHPVYMKIKNWLFIAVPALVMLVSFLIAEILCVFSILVAKREQLSFKVSKVTGQSLNYIVCGIIITFCLWKLGTNTFPRFRSSINNCIVDFKFIVISCLMLVFYSMMIQTAIYLFNANLAKTIVFKHNIELILYFIGICVLAPIYEELMRVLTIMNLEKVVSNKKTILIVQAIIFSVFHLSPSSLIVAIFGGLMLGSVYMKSKNIKINIFAHFLFNVFTLIPYGTYSQVIFVISLITFIASVIFYKKNNGGIIDENFKEN